MFQILNICSKNSFIILKFLGRNEGKSFYVREIAETVGLSPATVSRTLSDLKESAIVSREERGRLAMYMADNNNPLLREIKIVITLTEINELLINLKPLTSKIILFGSCSRGEDRFDSDIDMLILSKYRKSILREISNFPSERKLSPIVITKDEYFQLRTRDKPFYNQIKSGKLLWESEGDYEDLSK